MSEDTMTVDESPQPITDVKKKRRRRFIFVAAAVILWYTISFTVLITFAGKPFNSGKVPGIYWLALHQLDMVWVVIFAPIVVIIILLLIPGFLRVKQRGQLFLVFILIVLLVMVLTLFGPTIDQLDHIQTLRHSNHIYYLADSIPFSSRFIIADACLPPNPADYDPDCFPGYFTHEYMVYQCGQKGVVCQRVGYEAFEEHKYSSEGELSVNAEGSIVLTVDSRWVWTYPEDDQ